MSIRHQRITIFQSDDVTPILGSVDINGDVIEPTCSTDPTADRPYLIRTLELVAQELNFAEGSASIGQVNIDILDKRTVSTDQNTGWFTAILADVGGKQQITGHRILFEQQDSNGDYYVVLDGVIGDFSLSENYVTYSLVVRDIRERERKMKLFDFNPAGVSILPSGFGYDYGRMSGTDDGDTRILKTEEIGYLAKVHFEPGMGGKVAIAVLQNYKHRFDSWNYYVEAFKYVADYNSVDPNDPDSWLDAYTSARTKYIRVQWRTDVGDAWNDLASMPIIYESTWISGSAYLGAISISNGVYRAGSRYNSSGIRLTTDDPIGNPLPADGSTIYIRTLMDAEPSEDNPLYIEKTFGQLLKDIYDGVYTRSEILPIRYNAAAMAALVTNTPLARVKITKPVDDARKWVQEQIYKPLGMVPAINRDGEIVPTKYTLPEPDATLVQLDDTVIVEGNWTHPSDSIVNRVEFTYYRDTLVLIDQNAPIQNANTEFIEREVQAVFVNESVELHGPKTAEYDCVTVRGIADATINAVDPGNVQDELGYALARLRSKEIFDRFANGAQSLMLKVNRASPEIADLNSGDWVVVASSWMPNFATGERGINRVFQISSVNDIDPATREFKLSDGGQNLLPLDEPIVNSVGYNATERRIEVDITIEPDTVARVDYAISDLEPLQSSGLWTYAGALSADGILNIASIPFGRTIWVRARSESENRRPSAWTDADSYALDANATIFNLQTQILDGANPLVDWDVSPATLGIRLQYAVYGKDDDIPTSFTTYGDFDAADLEAELSTIRVPQRHRLLLLAEGFTGWDGVSSVTGVSGGTIRTLSERISETYVSPEVTIAKSQTTTLGTASITVLYDPQYRVLGLRYRTRSGTLGSWSAWSTDYTIPFEATVDLLASQNSAIEYEVLAIDQNGEETSIATDIIEYQGPNTTALIGEIETSNPAPDTIRARIYVANPFPHGEDITITFTKSTNIPSVTPLVTWVIDSSDVTELLATTGYIDVDIERPLTGDGIGRVSFVATCLGREIYSDAIDIADVSINFSGYAEDLLGDTLASNVLYSSLTTIGTLTAGAVPAHLVTAGAFDLGDYSYRGLLTQYVAFDTNPRTNWPAPFSTAKLLISSDADNQLALVRGDNGDSIGAVISLGRTGNVNSGILSLVAQFDTLGAINFLGATGAANVGVGGSIYVTTETVPSSTNLSSSMHFATTPPATLVALRRATLWNTGHFSPADFPVNQNNTQDLGLVGTTWRTGYFGTSVVVGSTTINSTSATMGGTLTVTTNLTVNGNTTIGNATSDTITTTARFASDIVASTANARDFGTTTLPFRTGYFGTSLAVGFTGAVNSAVNLDAVSKFGVRPSTSVAYPTVLAGGFAGRFYAVHDFGDWGFVIARAFNDEFGANLTLYHTRNSDGTRTALVNGDLLGRITYQGVSQTGGTVVIGAAIHAVVTGAVSTNVLPTELRFFTTTTSDADAGTARWIMQSSGHLVAGTDNSYDIGASAALRPRRGYFGTELVVPLVTATTLVGALAFSSLTFSGLTTGQVLRATSTTTASFGAVNLADTDAVTGVLPNGNTTADSANTVGAIVARDGIGNFSAGTITASLAGNALTATNVAWGGVTGTPTTIGGYGITDFYILGDAQWSLLGHTHTFASLTSKPTTIAGYGITDFNSLGDARWSLLAHTHTFASLTSIPTTIAGYGITDFNSLGDARWSLLAHTHTFASLTSKPTTIAGYGITDFTSLGDAQWVQLDAVALPASIVGSSLTSIGTLVSGAVPLSLVTAGTAPVGTFIFPTLRASVAITPVTNDTTTLGVSGNGFVELWISHNSSRATGLNLVQTLTGQSSPRLMFSNTTDWPGAANVIYQTASNHLSFTTGGTPGSVSGTTRWGYNASGIFPATTNAMTLGNSSFEWSDFRSVLATFSGAVTLSSTLDITGTTVHRNDIIFNRSTTQYARQGATSWHDAYAVWTNLAYDHLNAVDAASSYTYVRDATVNNVAGSLLLMRGNGTETGLSLSYYTFPTSTGAGTVPASMTLRFRVTSDEMRQVGTAAYLVQGGTTSSVYVGTGTGSSTSEVRIQAAAGQLAYQTFRSGTTIRWGVGRGSGAESVGNAGSPFAIYSYDDAGAFLRTNLDITRSTGAWAIAGTVAITSTTTTQFSTRYDSSNRLDIAVSSAGLVTYEAVGASAEHRFNDFVRVSNNQLFVSGTLTANAALVISSTITATGGVTRGLYSTPVLTAAANGDSLVAIQATPSFSVGAFTGTIGYGLLVGNVTGAATNYAIYTGTGLVYLTDAVTMNSTLAVASTVSAIAFILNGGSNIVRNSTSSYTHVSGGSNDSLGGSIRLYGQTHATQAKDIEFRADATVAGLYDFSALTWTFTGAVVLSSTLNVAAGATIGGALTVTPLAGVGDRYIGVDAAGQLKVMATPSGGAESISIDDLMASVAMLC